MDDCAGNVPKNCNGCKFKQVVSKHWELEDYCALNNKSISSMNMQEGCYDGEWKQGELLDLSVFSGEARNATDDDNWGEVIDFSIEEMLDDTFAETEVC